MQDPKIIISETLTMKSRAYVDEALKVMVDIMKNKKASPAIRLRAAESILERAYGKVREKIDITEELVCGVSRAKLDELKEAVKKESLLLTQ